MDALYAFMRVTDDLADEPGERQHQRDALTAWQEQLTAALAGTYTHPLHAALHHTVVKYQIPETCLYEVIAGVRRDLDPMTFTSFQDLRSYCYQVASVVGIACISIWGYRGTEALIYAEAAGIAFQLTNILRDLAEDLNQGRIYLPHEDLARFQSFPHTWRQRNESFRLLMRFEIERARQFYAEGRKLIPCLSPAGKAIFQAMTGIYQQILNEIENADYNVFEAKIRVPRWRKLRTMLGALPTRWGLTWPHI